MTRGLTDADLGGGVFKQRISREGEGKSAGYRCIVLLRSGELALFVYGFGKNCRNNIRQDELTQFRKMAGHALNLNDSQIAALIKTGHFEEVINNDQAI